MKQNNKVWIIIKLIICIILSLSLVGCMNISKKRKILNREKVKVEKYLKVKYGKEFVVTDAEFRHPELGKIKIDTTAYPKGNKKLKFRVTASPEEYAGIDSFDEDYEKTFYYDTYLAEYWSKSAYEELKPVVENIFGEDIEKLRIFVTPTASSDLDMTTILGFTPEYEEIKNSSPETIIITIEVDIYRREFDMRSESKKIMELIDKIRKPEFEHYEIQFFYDVNGVENICSIRKSNLDEIQMIEDIMEEFKD